MDSAYNIWYTLPEVRHMDEIMRDYAKVLFGMLMICILFVLWVFFL